MNRFGLRTATAAIALSLSPSFSQAQTSRGEVAGKLQAFFAYNTTVLEGADRRPQTSLDGDWHYIVRPLSSSTTFPCSQRSRRSAA